MKIRVAINGLGVITPLGNDAQNTCAAVKIGNSCIDA
jgi:hypothetical protein